MQGCRTTLFVTVLALFCLIAAAAAQRRFFYGWDESIRNIPYDGRFTFVRVGVSGPFDDTNEAYKLGVNYLMYGMTH
jgi:hypothetical protein